MTERTFTGGCLCGNVRYEISGEPLLSGICHCSMCRRAGGAPAVAWATFAEKQVEYSGAPPKLYQSSPKAKRGFCANCGTQIFFDATFLPGLVDITVGSMDEPELLPPTLHLWYSSHLSWAEFADDLPHHPEFPPFS